MDVSERGMVVYSFNDEDILAYKTLLEECEGVSLAAQRGFTGFELYSDDPNVETELGMGMVYGRQIILSRILLHRQRAGTMSKIFQLSLAVCRKHGIPKFVVQSTVTPAMVDWCIKHGMTPVEHTTVVCDGVVYGDYICEVPCEDQTGGVKRLTLG